MQIIHGMNLHTSVIELTDRAQKYLVLITPYFLPWVQLEESLKRAVTKGVNTTLLLRGGKDRADQERNARAAQLGNVRMKFLRRLHAKIYISESEAILTSMNLLKSSALDSWEVGIHLQLPQDNDAYEQTVKAAADLIDRAIEGEKVEQAVGGPLSMRASHSKTSPEMRKWMEAAGMVPTARRTKKKAAPKKAAPKKPAPKTRRKAVSKGVCIRCGDPIKLNPERPYCKECYAIWAEYENDEYEEEFCHSCGKEHVTTMLKPVCYPCYKKLA